MCRKFGFIFLLLFVVIVQAYAQEVSTNANGDKIIVYPDGSWRYAKENETIKTKEPQKILTESDIEKLKMYRLEYSSLEVRLKKIQKQEKKTNDLIEVLKNNRLQLERDLATAVENGLSDLSRKDLKVRLKSAREEEKDATYELDKYAVFSRDLIRKTTDLKSKIKKLEETMAPGQFLFGTADDPGQNASETKAKEQQILTRTQSNDAPIYNTITLSDPKKYFVKKESMDVMKYPPSIPCTVVLTRQDEFTGNNRKAVSSSVLFFHTPEPLKSYLLDRNYIECNAYLESVNDVKNYLILDIVINSKNGLKEFGRLESGSSLLLKLLDGSTITLFNSRVSEGDINEASNQTRYRGQYLLDPKIEKSLAKTELDKVRVYWSRGYEDYEVYDIDFLKHQIACLNE